MLLPLIKLLLLLLLLLRVALLHRRRGPHQRMRLLRRCLIVPRLRTAIFLRLHIPVRRLLGLVIQLCLPVFRRLRSATLRLRSSLLLVDPGCVFGICRT